jgi:hypothetical protein
MIKILEGFSWILAISLSYVFAYVYYETSRNPQSNRFTKVAFSAAQIFYGDAPSWFLFTIALGMVLTGSILLLFGFTSFIKSL